MSRGTCLVYATFDGIGTFQNGIGTQARNFLDAVAGLREVTGDSVADAVKVAYPVPQVSTTGYAFDPTVANKVLARARAAGVEPVELRFSSDLFWTESSWDQITCSLLSWIESNAERYSRLVAIAVDAVYLRLSDLALQAARLSETARSRLIIVHALYSTEKVPGMRPVAGRLAREQACVDRVNRSEAFIADIGAYFSQHLREAFGLTARPVPFRQSVALNSPVYRRMSETERDAVLRRFDVRLDRPTVVYAGRADPVKGFDILVEACKGVDLDFRLFAIVVPYGPHDTYLLDHKARLSDVDYEVTLVTEFSRELFHALCQSPHVRAVVCPSRGEPVGAVPHEVALWAEDGGPTVVAANTGGLREQIEDGVTGHLFEVGNADALTAVLHNVLSTEDKDRDAMRVRAAKKAREERDFVRALRDLLEYFRA